MKKKHLVTTVVATAMATAMSMTAFAAGWQQNTTGWWYATNDAGTEWHTNGWQWVDGNNDGVAECYYFDGNGYILAGTTTPDGYIVDGNGAWTVNDVIQTQSMQAGDHANGALNRDNGGYNSYGCSNVALEMLRNTREENAKYGETRFEDGTLSDAVVYANGFAVVYPKGGSTYKTVQVDRQRSDIDATHLFKYYDSSLTPDEAAKMLHNNGFAEGIKGAYSTGTTCWIEAGGETINWGKTYILLR